MSLVIRLIINLIVCYTLVSLPAIAEETATTPTAPTTHSEEKGLVFSFSGEFDKYFFPSKLDFALPVFQLNVKGVHVNLDDLAFNFHKDKTDKGLELANVSARARQVFVQVPEENALFNLENFETVTENQVQEDVINSAVRSKFERLTLPKQLTKTAEDLKLHYNSVLELQRLDAKSLLALQKYFYELRDSGAFNRLFEDATKNNKDAEVAAGMLGLSMLGKLSEIAPHLIAKSPEVIINDFRLTSEKSELSVIGHANLGVIGSQQGGTPPKPDAIPIFEGAAKFDVKIEKNLLNTLLELAGNVSNHQEKVKSLVAEKLINDTGSHYEATLTANYKDQHLTMSKTMETAIQMFDNPEPVDSKQDNADDVSEAVHEAVSLMQALSSGVAEQYQTTKKWTTTQQLSGETSGTYTAKIESNPKQLYLQATLKSAKDGVSAKIASKTIRLSYSDKDKTWKCEAGKPRGIHPKYLPDECR